MSRVKIQDAFDPGCPVRNVISRIGDKWSLLVLYTLQSGGVLRFKELQHQIPDISQKMLTVTLRVLVEDGFVLRKSYPVIPPKVEYSLTPRAEQFMAHVNPLMQWAKENIDQILHDRIANVS